MNTVAVVGEGTLADTVCRILSGFRMVRRSKLDEALPAADLVLVLQDRDDSSVLREAEQVLPPRGNSALRGGTRPQRAG